MGKKLSIVIVNYNVKYFLEQCLSSVRHASKDIETEVFVVDNNSVDSSVKMVREKFPEAILIENHENLGFSKANNQAINKATGDYILLLNPDTIVEDDTLVKVVDFMDDHPEAGGLGVKMIDGKGQFLPESKRGLPTPSVAFFKIFGFSRFFPKSRLFGKYHLGYLDKNETNEVDVLSGAFMLLRKSTLDKTGLLDETFFMYGEDIDLSYRITKAGYKNYYYPEARIIHYKGESTKKGSVNYVFIFYNAMIIFAKKHFSQKNARLFSFLINIAIYFRAFLAILNRFFSKAFLPILDATLIFGGIYLITRYWGQHVIFTEGGNYPREFTFVVVPIYIFIWLFSIFLSGGYDKPVRLIKILQGSIFGTVFILVVYALLPEDLRFSRALILFGALWGAFAMICLRLLLYFAGFKGIQIGSKLNRRFIIIGDKKEALRVKELLQNTTVNPGFIGLVSTSFNSKKDEEFTGNIDQVKEIIQIYKIDEVIFCSKSMPSQQIFDKMAELQKTQVDYKIAPEDSFSIIGSNSINTSGDLYTIQVSAISTPANRRNKRFLDLVASLILLVLSPVFIFIVKNPLRFLKNILQCLAGLKSWVGYCPAPEEELDKLPVIRKGVLSPFDGIKLKSPPEEVYHHLNFVYARDYNFTTDIRIIIRGARNLGR